MSRDPDFDAPGRWGDGAEGDELAEVIQAAQGEVPSAEQMAALSARLGLTTTSGVSALSAQTLTLGGLAVLAALGVGWYWARSARPTLPAPVAHSPEAETPAESEARLPTLSKPPAPAALDPSVVAPSAQPGREGDLAGLDRGEPEGTEPQPESPPVLDQPHTPARPSASSTSTQRDKVQRPTEVSLIRAARAALAADPERALALTRTHKRLYPAGVLTEEREVIAIEALQALGRKSEAVQKADTFRAEHPDSAHRPLTE